MTEVILSHHHGDHVGGLLTLRRELAKKNPGALKKAFVGAGVFLPRVAPGGEEANEALLLKKEYEELGGEFVVVERPTELFPGAWLTGPVPRVHPERNWTVMRKVRQDDGREVEDNLPEDMSLVFDTDKGLVLISGCGHAGIINTLEYARQKVRGTGVHAALGGFHLFEADAAALDWTAAKLRSMGLQTFLGAHCTGIESVFGLRQRLNLARASCAVGAVGSRFSLKSGLNRGLPVAITTSPRSCSFLLGVGLVAFQGGIIGIVVHHHVFDEWICFAGVDVAIVPFENGFHPRVLVGAHDDVASVGCRINQMNGQVTAVFERFSQFVRKVCCHFIAQVWLIDVDHQRRDRYVLPNPQATHENPDRDS